MLRIPRRPEWGPAARDTNPIVGGRIVLPTNDTRGWVVRMRTDPPFPLFAHGDELGEGGKYVVHCKSGARAAVSASLLKREGHEIALVQDDVANLANGKS